MRIAFLIFLSLLFVEPGISQNIRDTVFTDVLLINPNDVTTDGKDFLIDIPIQVQKGPIVILNNDSRIPWKLFSDKDSFLNDQDEIILITPDWEYYESIRKEEMRVAGLHLDPYVQNKVYHLQRKNGKVDSITVRMDDPRKPISINYQKGELQEYEVKYYYKNYPNFETNPNFETKAALESLNARYNIYERIEPTYASKGTRNPIVLVRYTLSTLSPEEKLLVVKEMDRIFKTRPSHSPNIYLSYSVLLK